MSILRSFVKSIPTLVLSIALAVAVWVSAVTASDPIQQRQFPRQITIEREGLATSLVISGEVPDQATITMSAPSSVWDQMLTERNAVRAWIDLSGLDAGTHTVDVHIQPAIQPSKVVTSSPRTVTVTLEKLVTQEFDIHLVQRGKPAVGYEAKTPQLDQNKVTISGPESQVNKINDVRVTVDLTQASDSINRMVNIEVVDQNDNAVDDLTVSPEQVSVNQPVTQLGGYRTVVVRVILAGQVASGYRLTNYAVFPPTVTLFSSNPQLVAQLPGYIETSPVDLTGIKDDLELRVSLNLPDGVDVVSGQANNDAEVVDRSVLVQIGVAPIEGSVTLTGLPIYVENLGDAYRVRISPETVDVIISGPVPLLDRLTEENVHVSLDLNGVNEGTYQYAPKVTISVDELSVQSILPSSVEVVVEPRGRGTPGVSTPGTPTPTRTPTASPTAAITPVPETGS